jgi:diguanylate cyclase (GGDEF)-like protein
MFKSPQQLRASLPVAAEVVLAAVLRACACYLIPIGIGLVSLLALSLWHNQYQFSDNLALDMRVLAQDEQTSTPFAALIRLQEQAPVRGFDTHLDETPFWFSFDTVHRMGGPEVIEFPSRHAVDIACWDTAGLTLLGAATTNNANPQPFQTLTAAKAGFALRLAFMPSRLLCRARFAGPGHLSVAQWPAEQFALSIDQYHRKSGLLDGGMIVLALFVLIIAAVYRQMLYLVFAGWLILNLRIGSMLAGWDVQWLGQMVPPLWLMAGRAATVVLYGISTLTLYQMLLGDHLATPRQRLAIRIVQWLCLPMLVAAFVLPFHIFIPVLWAITASCICLLTLDLARILYAARSRVALYFALALVVAFASGMSEIIVGALDLRALQGVIDSVTAALASSLLAAVAVAEQIRVETARRLSAQAELGSTWEAMPAALFTLDREGRFLAHNPALRTLLANPAIVHGRTTWASFFGAAAWLRLHELVQAQELATMDIGQGFELDGECGERFMVRASLSRGRIDGVLENITRQTEETAQLRYMAHHDSLTGVLNRRGSEQAFESATATLAAGKPLALAFLDLDRFKLINDLYGHAAGDEVLKQVCERVMAMLTGGQHIGRIGGDAFLLLLPDAPVPAATLACRAIVERIAGDPYLVGDKAVTVRASLGLINVMPGMHMAEAIASAERACREAKSATGAGLGHASAAEGKLVARLSSPNATEGLFLDMKPIVALAAPAGSLNLDVLLRMRAADGSIVVAAPIIAAAEKSGRAGVIDRWVLGTALDWIARNKATLPRLQFVSIKISGAALNDEHFVQDLLVLLQRHSAGARRLCLAISEHVALQDLDNTRRFIGLVRAYGVKVALDEFGALHTSFSYLKQLQADFLKIDAGLSANLRAHPANGAIVEAMVHLARKLGMKTIAPGIQDPATVRALAAIGVDYVQGEGVARPQPLDAFLAAQSSASFVDAAILPELAVPADVTGQKHKPAPERAAAASSMTADL